MLDWRNFRVRCYKIKNYCGSEIANELKFLLDFYLIYGRINKMLQVELNRLNLNELCRVHSNWFLEEL